MDGSGGRARRPLRQQALCGLLILPALAAPWDAAAQAARAEIEDVRRVPRFVVGETNTYDLRIGPFTVGRAMFHVEGMDTVGNTLTVHAISAVKGGVLGFGVHDRTDSWFDPRDFAPRRFIQDLHEGTEYSHSEWHVDPDSGHYREVGIDSTLPTPPSPLDNESFMYFLREMDLVVGERHELSRYFRSERNPIVIEVTRRDTIDVPAGRFPAIVVEPLINARGYLSGGKRTEVWISDDARRLIVQIKVRTKYGPVTMRLTSVDDPPHPDLLTRPSERNRGR